MKALILCDHELRQRHRRALGGREPDLRLSVDRLEGNVYFRPEALEKSLGAPLDPVSLDLCEIASYVYLGDKAVARGKFENWVRDLAFVIPVRAPELWNGVRDLLTQTVATLSGDNVRFEFVEKQTGPGRSDPGGGGPPPGWRSDCVCLFSGGLDSFAGAVDMVRNGRRPLLASHYVSGLKGVQRRLAEVQQDHLGVEFEHFQYRVTSRRPPRESLRIQTRESTHRARSFLFLGFAAVAAAVRGLSEIFIYENGVLSLNVPLSEARKGTRSTRHAHPLYLSYFNELIDALYSRRFQVRNPFLFMTKGEEVELVRRHGLQGHIRDTVSCWGYPNLTARYRDSNHCGACIPCIVRRVSMISAGLEDRDDRYVVDIFRLGADATAKDLRNVEDLVYFCQSFAALSKTELLLRYPELVMVETGDGAEADPVEAILRVYRRFANEVLSIVEERCPGLLDPELAAARRSWPEPVGRQVPLPLAAG